MRKNIHPRIVLALLIFGLFLISCRKNDRDNFVNNDTKELSDYKFLNQELKKFANAFIPALKNNAAKNIIRNKAKEKFDEEYEVLILDIFKEPIITSLVSPLINKTLHTNLFKRSGEVLYPQIYIPRFQYLEDNSSRLEVDTTEEVVYVFYSGNAEVDSAQGDEIYPGYVLVDDEFIYYTMVDEDYANEHEVWVFSLNESPEYYRGTLPCEIDPCAPGCPESGPGCGGGGGGGGGQGDPDDDPTDEPAARNDFPDLGHNKINFRIQNMKVTINNESWLSGASEVAIRAKLVCHNGRHLGIPGSYPDQYSSDQYSKKIGKLIDKFKRKDVKDGIWHNALNYVMQTNWQNEVPSQDPVHFIYTIFERDKWPAYVNTDEFPGYGKRYALSSPISGELAPPDGFSLYYRAEKKNTGNYPYAKSHFINTLILVTADKYAGSGLVESQSGGIYFNTVLY